jgi:hypothetical protein
MNAVNALVANRAEMSLEDAEFDYIANEMIEPLIGGTIIAGRVEEADGLTPFPVLIVKVKGKTYKVTVSMDDEQNGGGRLLVEQEAK